MLNGHCNHNSQLWRHSTKHEAYLTLLYVHCVIHYFFILGTGALIGPRCHSEIGRR